MSYTDFEDTVAILPQSDRLQILTPEEYELLWGLPQLSQTERELFFTLSPLLRRNVHRALNRGEAYHRLRRAIA